MKSNDDDPSPFPWEQEHAKPQIMTPPSLVFPLESPWPPLPLPGPPTWQPSQPFLHPALYQYSFQAHIRRHCLRSKDRLTNLHTMAISRRSGHLPIRHQQSTWSTELMYGAFPVRYFGSLPSVLLARTCSLFYSSSHKSLHKTIFLRQILYVPKLHWWRRLLQFSSFLHSNHHKV